MTPGLAAVIRGTGADPVVCDVEFPHPAPDEVLVRVAGSGICHTDIHAWNGRYGIAFPAVLGHEGAGVVEAIGTEVTGVEVGQHVVLSFDSCGSEQCGQCSRGLPSYCPHFMALNMGAVSDGARARQGAVGLRWFGQSSFASHVTIRAHCVVPVSHVLPLHLLGPMACSFLTGAGAVFNDLDVQRGQRVAIFGAGAVGLAAVMAARIAGAGEVTVCDQDADRLAIAVELGATRTVLAPREGAIPDKGLGAYDCALDTTSNAAVARTALRNLDPPGQLVLVGGSHLEITPIDLAGRRLTLSMEGSADPHTLVPRLCEYWRSGQFPVERIITKYALTDVAQALDDASSGRVIKPVLIP